MIFDKDSEGNKIINWERVVMFIGLIGTLGLGAWANTQLESMVENAIVSRLSDPHSRISSALEVKTSELASTKMGELANVMILADFLEGHNGLTGDALIASLDSTLDFTNKLKRSFSGIDPDDIALNNEWISKQRLELESAAAISGDQNVKMETVGSILSINGVPSYFREANGELLKIYYDKPYRRDGRCYRFNIYYIRSERDMVRILETISDILLEDC